MLKTDELNTLVLRELTSLGIEPTRQNCLDFLLGYRETLEEAVEALEFDSYIYRRLLLIKREATRVEIEINFQK